MDGRTNDDVYIAEDVRVGKALDTGKRTHPLDTIVNADENVKDHCLGTQMIELSDVSLGETIFCRQIDAGKYLDHPDELATEELNVSSASSDESKGEVELPKAKGSYVLGKIQEMGCVMTVDTACTQTIVSKQMYYRIPRGKRPKLEGRGILNQAGKDAPPIEVLGRGIFTLQLGPLKLTPRLLIVADISDQVLLGDNLLREDPALGPGDIMYSEKVLRLGGKHIPLRMVSTPECALRVVSIDDEIIPAMSEKLVDGFLQRPETDIQGESSMLVETSTTFRDRFGCLLTPIVVDTKGKVSTCIRILNPFPQSILIPGGVTMGELEPVEVLRVVKKKENGGEDLNFSHCRCIVFTTDGRQGTNNTTHDRCQGVQAEFRAGARRAPKRPRVCTSASCRAEAGPRTEIINESASCRDEAGPRTEIINESASCRAEAGPRTEIINESASCRAEAGPRTEIINESASCRAEAGPWTEIINASASCRAEAGPRTEIINESASCRAEAGPRTEILNVVTSDVAEADLQTETTNGGSSQGMIVKQQTTTDDDGGCQGSETIRRTAMQPDGTNQQTDDGQVTKQRHLIEGSDTDPQVEETGRDGEIPPHMKDFIERSIKGWSKPQQEAIQRMLLQFQDVFSRDELDIGQTHLMEAEIDTGNAKPIRSRPRPMARSMEEEGRKTIGQMEARGLIRPSKSPWASNVTLVWKPNGKIRITIDYRGLNLVTQVPVSNQPRTQDCIDALAKARYFSLGDSSAAYHQIKMKEEDIPKTAFITKFGLFEWTVLPMGLLGAPFCYTRLMELALAGLQWDTCVIYLDDVIVFGRTFDEHLTQLTEVSERFRSAGLKLKPEKCQFFQREVKFLGYLISAEGVKPHPDNVQKIVNWPTPQSPTDVRAILGMGNCYRRFIQGYSREGSPLSGIDQTGCII